MKICFPVLNPDGLESEVYGHFGSAPSFIIVDTDTNEVTTINNKDQHHAHGACNPLRAFDNHKVDSLIVGGIGGGALNKLNSEGIRVFQAKAKTVRENIELLKGKNLLEFSLQQCCPGHTHKSGCKH
ncbi:MAG: diguanylate cyclase [Nitrospirae bacterium]|nr:diguanylate cyclase [Nitrospirota bacterium]